jgi:phytoene/squalene synthetase
MKLDLKSDYHSQAEYEEYIYGSADVVGLMCLKVLSLAMTFSTISLKEAMRLGSAFQKVNLRDLKDDNLLLNRNYFPSRSQIFDENAKELTKKSRKI